MIDSYEIADLTGVRFMSSQIKWLHRFGIPFDLTIKGWPKVEDKYRDFLTKTGKNIMKEKIKVKKTCAVYFLIRDNVVVYVGQTKNLQYRIGKHTTLIDFDHYSFIECDKSELTRLERSFIKYYNPELNSNGVNNASPPGIVEVLQYNYTVC